MSDFLNPTLTLEQRVSALEAALTESEQWNVCVCGHHGSAHSPGNWCLTCECPHFATKRRPNERVRGITADEHAALRRILGHLHGRGPVETGDAAILARMIEGQK